MTSKNPPNAAPKSPTNPSNEKEYLGEIGGMPVIKDPKATETHFRSPLASDPKKQYYDVVITKPKHIKVTGWSNYFGKWWKV